MANGNSLVAADVTDSILAIGVGVVALNGKRTKNLSSNVSVTANLCVCDVNVEYVIKLECKCEGIHRGDGSYDIKNVVCVNGLTANGNNGVDRSVYHILDKLALVDDKGCDSCAGDVNGDVLCLNYLACELTNVGVSSGDKVSDHSLCLVANGKIKGNYVVNSLVVLAKSDVGHLYDVGKDGNRLNVCKSAECGDDLGRHSRVGAAKLCENVCKSECYLVDNNVVVNVEAVVVTKSCNCCIGVNCVDGKHGLVVVKVVCGVSISRRLYSESDNVHNGDLYGVVCILTKLTVEPAHLEHLNHIGHAECVCVSIEKLNNVYGVGVYAGNASLYKSVINGGLCVLNVGKVGLANESCPVKILNSACNVGCKNAVDSAVKSCGNLLDTCGSKDTGECVCNVSVKVIAKSAVKVLACEADCLHYCIVDSGSAAICNGDEVSASDICCGYLCEGYLLILISAKVKSICDDVCVAVVAVYNCKVEGVLGKLKLAGNDACNVLLNSVYDTCDHLVGIGLGVATVYECINRLDKSADLCIDLCLNACDDSLYLYDSGLNLCVELCDSSLKLCLCSLELCLCNGLNVSVSVYESDSKECAEVVYIGGKSSKKLNNLCKALCIKLICVVNKVSYLVDSNLCICECGSKCGSELCASDVLGILCYPSLCEVNVVLCVVKVCVNHIDHACLESLVVCELVSLVDVSCKEVSKDSEVLYGLVLCGVLGLVCGDNSLFKNVVSCCGGVTTKTVTNYASAHKAKKTCNGFVGLKSGAKCIGKCEEGNCNLDHICVCNNLGYDHIRDRCSDISCIGSTEYRNHNSLCCCGDFLRTVTTVENGNNILCGYYKIKVNSNLSLDAGLKVSFNKSCYNSASSHCLVLHACLKILIEGIKNAAEQGSVNVAKTKNSIKSYRSIYGVKDSLLNSKIYRNGNCLFCIRCSISELLLIIHKLVSHDLFESNGNKRKRALKKRPNYTVTVITNDSLYESITDNGIGVRSAVYVEIITVNLNKALDSTSLCIVEGCICVSCVLATLLKGRICSKECVSRSYNGIHDLADSNARYLTLVSEGVHNANLNKLNVGIHCNDGIVERHVVKNHRKADVNCLISDLAHNLVFSVLCRQSLKNLCHKCILVSKNLFLSLSIKIANCSLNVVNVVLYVNSTLEANNVENSAEAEHTKVTVTNCKRDNVSIGYVLLEVLSNNSNLHSAVLTELKVSIGIISSGILIVSRELTLVSYTLILSVLCLCGTGNSVISSIGSLVIADLGKSPVVTGGEYGVPKIFTILASVRPLFLTSDKLCENVDRLSVVVIKSKKPKKVLNSDTGHSELGMLVCAKPCCEQVRIRVIAIRFYTGAVLVSGETVTIGHRVSKRNVMDSLVLVLVRVGNTGSESGSRKAEEHCACHDQSKNLRTYFFHIHIFSLSDTFRVNKNNFL